MKVLLNRKGIFQFEEKEGHSYFEGSQNWNIVKDSQASRMTLLCDFTAQIRTRIIQYNGQVQEA